MGRGICYFATSRTGDMKPKEALNFAGSIAREIFRATDAAETIARDKALLRGAATNLAFAVEFPVQEALAIYRASQGKKGLAQLSKWPDLAAALLDEPAVRAWLKHWSQGGPKKLRERRAGSK